MKILSNYDFDDIFEDDTRYLGTYSKDMLLDVKIPKDQQSFAVINLQDEDDGGGTHWVAFYNDPVNQAAYYFDSFGMHPPDEVEIWINKYLDKQIWWNSTTIQDINSVACGMYCWLFIHKIDDMSFYDFIAQFKDRDGYYNEKLLLAQI